MKNSFFCYNGKFYSHFPSIASLDFLDSDFIHYGYGVFTSILYKNEKIFFFKEHLQRLKTSCQHWKIPYQVIPVKTIHNLINKNSKQKNNNQFKIKIIFLRQNNKANYFIFLSPLIEINGVYLHDENIYNNNEIDKYKTCNYMNSIKNVKIIKKKLLDVVKKNNKNKIVETSIGNIAILKNNTLQVVDSSKNIFLEGIFQKKLLQNYQLFFDKVIFKNGFSTEDIHNADNIFHLNSVRGINLIEKYCNKKLQGKLKIKKKENFKVKQKIAEINNFFFS